MQSLPPKSPLPQQSEVVIVGAGLAGLAAARALCAAGREVVVLECDDGPGGRVRTDTVDGFRLDRGFQVLLTAYPEVDRQLDTRQLDLRSFDPGALVWTGSGFHRVADPLRQPSAILSSARAPIGSLLDKARMGATLLRARRADPRDLLREPDISTINHLRDQGFSDQIIERFWRPLFGGIQLDPELTASRRMFEVVLHCLAVGSSAVPALGMQEIPDQMLPGLPEGTVRFGTTVAEISPGTVRTADGHEMTADHIVVATEGPAASALLGLPEVGSRSVGCVWFAAAKPPVTDKLIVLDGARSGPALNVAIMSNVAPDYSPDQRSVIAAACPGVTSERLESEVRHQLRNWWGPQVDEWKHLRTDVIEHGQPDSAPPLHPRERVGLGEGLWVCGDHRDTPSIQGALFSGRRCAEALLSC